MLNPIMVMAILDFISIYQVVACFRFDTGESFATASRLHLLSHINLLSPNNVVVSNKHPKYMGSTMAKRGSSQLDNSSLPYTPVQSRLSRINWTSQSTFSRTNTNPINFWQTPPKTWKLKICGLRSTQPPCYSIREQ
jgi:hypothetical protein